MSGAAVAVESSQMDGKQDTSIQASGSVSFDDFDRMESSREDFSKSKEVEGKPEVKKVEPEKEEKTEEKKETKEEKKEAKRMLKLLSEDSELEIPEDAVREIKINGKMEKVKLTDLEKNYSGHVDYSKKYSDFNKEKQSFTKDKENVSGMVTKFNELAKGEDVLAPLNFLIDTGKGDAYAYQERLRSHFRKEFEAEMNLSDAEQAALQHKRENEFLKSRQKSQEEQSKQDLQKQESTAKTATLLKENNISDEDFNSASSQLKERNNKDYSPEQVVEYMTKYVPASKTEFAVMEKLGDKANVSNEIRNQMWKVAFENPEFTPDDIIEIMEPVLKASKKSSLKEKIEGSKTKVFTPAKGYESFDDLTE